MNRKRKKSSTPKATTARAQKRVPAEQAKRTAKKAKRAAKPAAKKRTPARPKVAARRSARPSDVNGALAAMRSATSPELSVRDALRIAIDFEHKVRDHYARGAAAIRDPQGARVFTTLAREEQSHVDYLESRLAQWNATGNAPARRLKTVLPTPEWVREAEVQHRKAANPRRIADETELELLKIALRLELEASGFYNDLVRRVPLSDRAIFEPFLTIEDGHLAIVQAELDAVQGWGYWFDVPEFALEAQ